MASTMLLDDVISALLSESITAIDKSGDTDRHEIDRAYWLGYNAGIEYATIIVEAVEQDTDSSSDEVSND